MSDRGGGIDKHQGERGQEDEEESAPHSTPGQTYFSAEDVRNLVQTFSSQIDGLKDQIVQFSENSNQKKKIIPVPSEKPLDNKSYDNQVKFCREVLAALEEEDGVKDATRKLKERIELLKVADKHPGVFAMMEAKRQAEDLKNLNPMLAQCVEDFAKEQKRYDRKRRFPSQQPFRHRESARHPGSRFPYASPATYIQHAAYSEVGPTSFRDDRRSDIVPRQEYRSRAMTSAQIAARRDIGELSAPSRQNLLLASAIEEVPVHQVDIVRINPLSVASGQNVHEQSKRSEKIFNLLVGSLPKTSASGSQSNSSHDQDKRHSKAMASEIATAQQREVRLDLRWEKLPEEQEELLFWKAKLRLCRYGLPAQAQKGSMSLQLHTQHGPVERDYGERWRRLDEMKKMNLGRELSPLVETLDDCLLSSRAKPTIERYYAIMEKFRQWRCQHQLENQLDLARVLYLAEVYRSGQKKSLPTISAALNFYFDPLPLAWKQVETSLLGSASRTAQPTINREKISLEDFEELVETAASTQEPSSRRSGIIALLCFRAVLRLSEALQLKRTDIAQQGAGRWSLVIRRSKADQEGQGSLIPFLLTPREESFFSSHLKGLQEQHRFMFQSASTGNPITKSSAAAQLKVLFAKAQLDNRKYTSHSFSGGAATLALQQGLDTTTIMRAGRWRSFNAFQAYIRPAPLPIVAKEQKKRDEPINNFYNCGSHLSDNIL